MFSPPDEYRLPLPVVCPLPPRFLTLALSPRDAPNDFKVNLRLCEHSLPSALLRPYRLCLDPLEFWWDTYSIRSEIYGVCFDEHFCKREKPCEQRCVGNRKGSATNRTATSGSEGKRVAHVCRAPFSINVLRSSFEPSPIFQSGFL